MQKNRFIFVLVLSLLVFPVYAAKQILNVYSWTAYIPDSIIKKFEERTHITVYVSEYDSNETMYAKMMASPHVGYDIVLPSSYYVERLARQGRLLKLDKSKLTNVHNLNPIFLNKEYDLGNVYSLPYLWGTTGIVVNSAYFNPETITHWKDLWRPEFVNQLLLLDDMRDVFAMALIVLGYSVNDINPAHIKDAYFKLKELMPNIKIFNSDIEQNIYIDEDAAVGMGYSGDIHLTRVENKNIRYIYPQEGFTLWIDSIAIPNDATHIENAYKFINFLLEPEIAKEISVDIGYSTPNQAAMKLLPAEIQNDQVVNPNAKTLARAQIERDTPEVLPLYEKYWELLKIGG